MDDHAHHHHHSTATPLAVTEMSLQDHKNHSGDPIDHSNHGDMGNHMLNHMMTMAVSYFN